MKKTICAVMSILLLAICLAGCQEEPSLPNGVGISDGFYYYIFDLPAGEKLAEHFEFVGGTKKILMSVTNGTSYMTRAGAFYYGAVADGGWVMWHENTEGKAVYFPKNFPAEKIENMCATFAITGFSSSMSIEEARAYINAGVS